MYTLFMLHVMANALLVYFITYIDSTISVMIDGRQINEWMNEWMNNAYTVDDMEHKHVLCHKYHPTELKS